MSIPAQVGELRPSQLLYTFGVGAMVDLPNLSALVMGLEDWDTSQARTVVEDRLLQQVRRQLGPQVERLLLPPTVENEEVIPFDARPRGVPVSSFPNFLLCPLCNRLGPRRKGIFDLKASRYRPEWTRYVHTNCQKATGKEKPAALAARFLVACERGHLDDFPWVRFVHDGEKGCNGELTFYERGISGEATDVVVKCRACNSRRMMSDAFTTDGLQGYRCRGRRPHLRDFEEGCSSEPKAVLLGASNGWFPVTTSVLYVPRSAEDELQQLVEERWGTLSDVDALSTVIFLRKRGELGPLFRFTDAQIFSAIEARRRGEHLSVDEDIRDPEWRVFCDPAGSPSSSDFQLRSEAPPASFAPRVMQVVLAERLREVSALTGFTRLGSALDYDDAYAPESAHRMRLSRNPPTFVPAAEVRGEGIFIRLSEEAVAEFVATNPALEAKFRSAHGAWRRQRGLDGSDRGFPGLRYVLIHSFAHALIRALAVECGYTASSIKERIYSRDPFLGPPMAGVLLYTAAPDSEGTLGGLVSLGRAQELDRLIHQALEAIRICAADPLCSEHSPAVDVGPRTLHGAACHACLFLPETACERGNRYLDRAVLVETASHAHQPFFAEALR